MQNAAASDITYHQVGLVAGPLVCVLMLLTESYQASMDIVAWRTAGIALWMAIWWATEAVPVAATALLPIATFSLLGVASVNAAVAPYAHPTIFLFLGAFMLAAAVEKWHLHKRIALFILARTGTDGRRLIGGLMATSAFLSMWISNTSATMMLLPIALSVVSVIRDNVDESVTPGELRDFQTAMLLGLAYAATIGGVATLIGTPPNALLAAFLEKNYQVSISFFDWMLLGVPIALVMLPITWGLLTRVIYKVTIPASQATHQHLRELQAELGPMSQAEQRIALLFAAVIAGWILRLPVSQWLGIEGLSDTGIVMVAAISLFIVPNQRGSTQKLLAWEDTSQLPWGVLVLFGGGLSLAATISSSGLALWLGENLSALSAFGSLVLIIAAVVLVIFLTELTSNLATTATFLPVVAAIAIQAGISPLLLCIPITLAASFAFMLPVATPPNAVVFASGMVSIPQMLRAGILLNIIGALLLSLVGYFWAPQLFGG